VGAFWKEENSVSEMVSGHNAEKPKVKNKKKGNYVTKKRKKKEFGGGTKGSNRDGTKS